MSKYIMITDERWPDISLENDKSFFNEDGTIEDSWAHEYKEVPDELYERWVKVVAEYDEVQKLLQKIADV